MDFLVDTEIGILIGAGVVVALLLAYVLAHSAYRVVAKPNPASIVQYETIPVGVSVQFRSWSFGQWRDVPATFIVKPSPLKMFDSLPVRGGTSDVEPVFSIQVTAAKIGKDHLCISATPAGLAHAHLLRVPVTITPAAEGEGRFRQTAAALAASVRL